jgi:hypothetical protein
MEESFEKQILKYLDFILGQKYAKKYFDIVNNEKSKITRKVIGRAGGPEDMRGRLCADFQSDD